MNPVGAYPSSQRRLWRAITATAAILAAFSLLASVWLFTQVQDSRRDNIHAQCLAQNARHDRTIQQLDRLLALRLRAASGRERRRLVAGRQSTVLLINALAPRRRCDLRADRLTSTAP